MNTKASVFKLNNLKGPLILSLVWGALFLVFSITVENGRFATIENFQTILRQVVLVGLLSAGMTLIVINGAIDLSVGSVVALVTVVIAYAMDRMHLPPMAAVGIGLLVGVLCGAINGMLVSFLRISPFIVTLGTLLLFRGAAKGIADEKKIDAPMTWINQLSQALPPERSWMIFPPTVWLWLGSLVAVGVLLQKTVFGRRVFAAGSNETAAKFSGIQTSRIRAATFMIGGLFAGLAGLTQFSRLTVGDPTVAQGIELDAVAAVVIGGGSLAGGEGSVIGSAIGALIMATLRAGCSQLGMDNWIQELITGGIIIIAVAVDRIRHRTA